MKEVHMIIDKVLVRMKGDDNFYELMDVKVVVEKPSMKVFTKYVIRTSGGKTPVHTICELEDIDVMEAAAKDLFIKPVP